MQVRRMLGISLLVLLASASDHRIASDDAKIYFSPGFGGGGIGLPDTEANSPYVFSDLTLCLDRAGSITIDRIESIDEFGGLRIDDFAIGSMHHGEDHSREPLSALGLGKSFGPVILDAVCLDAPTENEPVAAAPRKVAAVLLQYGKNDNSTAGNRGIVIYYTSGGRKYWVLVPFFVVLCGPGATREDHPICTAQ